MALSIGWIFWMAIFLKKNDTSIWNVYLSDSRKKRTIQNNPARFLLFLLDATSMSGSPPSFSDYLYFYSFMDRNVHAHFYRQPISIDCQVLFIFFFSGRLCRNRYCTFLDFQNRFDKVCRIVFWFVHRPLADSFRRNLLQNGNASAFPDFSVSFKTRNPAHIRICHITLQFVPVWT